MGGLKGCTKYFGPYSMSQKMHTYSRWVECGLQIYFCLPYTMFFKFSISFQHTKLGRFHITTQISEGS